jgi:hypothetical protein
VHVATRKSFIWQMEKIFVPKDPLHGETSER